MALRASERGEGTMVVDRPGWPRQGGWTEPCRGPGLRRGSRTGLSQVCVAWRQRRAARLVVSVARLSLGRGARLCWGSVGEHRGSRTGLVVSVALRGWRRGARRRLARGPRLVVALARLRHVRGAR